MELLFDSACSKCSGIAADVERVSGRTIGVRSLYDAEAQRRVREAGKTPRWEPTLVVDDDGTVTAYRGVALVLKVAAALGPRKAWRLARVLGGRPVGLPPADLDRQDALG